MNRSQGQSSHAPQGESDSLSLGHNSASAAQPELPFKLTGSQKKTAYALRQNCQRMIEEAGIECVAFVTFNLGERDQWGDWQKVFDAKEAGRRINNLARHILPELFEKFILVTERHKDGGIHFHALAVVKGRPDIRTGFDFAAVEDKDYSSASDAIRRVWEALRSKAVANLGFGRCETLPIKSCGEAVATYVSKYIEKNICNRLSADKGKKLVRYHGWNGEQMKPNGFCWSTPKACEWRRKVTAIAATVGLKTPAEVRAEIGPRWAYRLHGAMFELKLESVTEWHEGEMTRDQVELAREFMRRDAQTWEESTMKEKAAMRIHPNIWDRPLTPEEAAQLATDLDDYRADQLARGLDFQ